MNNSDLKIHESHLTPLDQQLLIAHANGLTNSQIAKSLGLDLSTVSQLNRGLQKQLQAKSLPHAITQAFVQGILSVKQKVRVIDGEHLARTLCLCLAILSGLNTLQSDVMRTRSPVRNHRSPTTIARVRQAGRNKEIDV
ncbi:LuxR C-terminal-related transcriptional regulator [Vibrio vulnificus]|uniref:LuxR C-terminal-related transcriptional regulator n=1 Tax=Vibrio vulnificus TaxID=672 RepID=UPI001A203C6B|nr:LuxR C-terminal-related transcriptional regulator [Vibrio vulnificus]MCJ0806677.1 LuxR C-terminal-related transcriptional regulator [Vibrio vulnificus]HAS6087729.1 hypothetical protein [Vibrio vulnificus]